MEFVNESKSQETLNDNEKIEEENVELDLEEYGKIEIKSSGSKPIFEKITKGLVLSAVLMKNKERKEETNKDGKIMSFYQIYLKCTFNVEGKEVFENYGGGRLYVSDKKEETRFWLGENSALGKLKQIIADNKDFKGSVEDITPLLIGQTVGIKTEVTNVSGKDYTKNVIKQFY